jgi:short-subunit dehydrogenase
MARRTLAGLRILVTGASQGLGRAIALAAAGRGAKVLAVSRSQPPLDGIETFAGDVTNPADREAMVRAALDRFGGLDVLVNNAGVGATGHFVESSPETLRAVFETNFFGTTEMIRACLPMLKQGVTPAIVNISSVVGKRAVPDVPVYSASKFAVAGFSEAVRAELAKDGIDVIVVNPGLTRTNFGRNMIETLTPPIDDTRGMPAEAAAGAVLRALERGSSDTTLTLRGKLTVLASRYAPRVVDYFARRRVRRRYAAEIARRNGSR